MAGSGQTGKGAIRKDRPFFFRRRIGGILALATGFAAPAAIAGVVAFGHRGDITVELRDCASGAVNRVATLPAPLSVRPVFDVGRSTVLVATTDGALHSLDGTTLGPVAREEPGFTVTALATAPGDAGFALAGGRGEPPMSARSPVALEEIHRYRRPDSESLPSAAGAGTPVERKTGAARASSTPERSGSDDALPQSSAEVSAILPIVERQRFVVAFTNQPLIWEIAWNPDAPPVLLGLVHDYRMGEAVPLPGRLTARPFKVAEGTRHLIAGASSFEVLRIDARGRVGVIDLNVRREIERLPQGPQTVTGRESIDAKRIAAWRSGSSRGWIFARPGASAIELFEAGRWKVSILTAAPGEVLAMTADAGTGKAWVAHRRDSRIEVSRLSGDTLSPLWTAEKAPEEPVELQAHPGCTVLVDRQGRWVTGFLTGDEAGPVSR